MAQNDSLILRSLRADDQAALEEVVGRVWAYDRFCSPRTARSLTALGFQSSLYQSTFGRASEAYFRKAGGTRLYLCTDSRCNYGL